MGVAAGSAVKRTRLDGWVLRRKVADTPAESTEEVLSEQSEAGFGERSEVPLSGVSCAPWSSGNNCTVYEEVTTLCIHSSFCAMATADETEYCHLLP